MEVLGIIAAVFVMYVTYKLIFGSWEELSEALGFWLTPDIFSWFRGEAMEDFFAELKLGVWIVSGLGSYFGVMSLIDLLNH